MAFVRLSLFTQSDCVSFFSTCGITTTAIYSNCYNYRLSKVLFNLTESDYQYLIDNQDTIGFVEMNNHKKFGEIVSHLKIDIDVNLFPFLNH